MEKNDCLLDAVALEDVLVWAWRFLALSLARLVDVEWILDVVLVLTALSSYVNLSIRWYVSPVPSCNILHLSDKQHTEHVTLLAHCFQSPIDESFLRNRVEPFSNLRHCVDRVSKHLQRWLRLSLRTLSVFWLTQFRHCGLLLVFSKLDTFRERFEPFFVPLSNQVATFTCVLEHFQTFLLGIDFGSDDH